MTLTKTQTTEIENTINNTINLFDRVFDRRLKTAHFGDFGIMIDYVFDNENVITITELEEIQRPFNLIGYKLITMRSEEHYIRFTFTK